MQFQAKVANSIYLARLWAGGHVWSRLLPGSIHPISANLKLTENCQAKCMSCDYWKSTWEDAYDTEQAIALINRLAQIGIRNLRLTGGEPLLRRDLFEILRRAETRGFRRITVQTNGLLLKRYASEINASPITDVSVSIDGIEKSNDHIRGVKGYFRTAFEGLKMLKGKQLQVAVTINRESADELPELIDIVNQYDARIEFNLLENRLYFFRNSDLSELWPRKDQIAGILAILRDRCHRPNYECEYVMRYFNRDPAIVEPACVLGFIQIDVASNGDLLTGCYVLPPIANLLKTDIATVLRSKEYMDRCLAMLRRECPGCTCGIYTSLKFENTHITIRDVKTAFRQ